MHRSAILYPQTFTLILLITLCAAQSLAQDKTVFQTAQPWIPELDIRSDVAIVYGVNGSFPDRVNSWRDRGYGIHMMTGVAWGNYQDYINGEFDGKNHMDEGQVERNGEMIMHNPTVPYMVPSQSYIDYLKTKIKTAIDNGVEAIHLEEPEFWNRAGYSDGFKREWQAYYNEDWQAQHTSPDATYRSAKLKYHLYFRALKELFLYAKDYSESIGNRVKCYVPTHTLVNYSAWSIVSPESNLAALPGMDGYIAQVWTGTARTPVYYDGVEKERTFENAFIEYASMIAMTKPTNSRVYFLTDPIEDNPNHSWEDYKKNYEDTFIAQLLHPTVEHYEVMPWPNRIFRGKYITSDSEERQGIPADYATQLMVMINALNHIKATDQPLPGTNNIGVVLSDTMMFQRFPTHEGYEDPRLSNFYGMALPLVKKGIPLNLIQIENLHHPETLDGIDILVMSYANMKPLKPEYHQHLIDWVKEGNSLIYMGRDQDPFQSVTEWWNSDENHYNTPSEHLFELAGITEPIAEIGSFNFKVGNGNLVVHRIDPKEIVMQDNGDDVFHHWIGEQVGILKQNEQLPQDYTIQHKNQYHLIRNQYDVVGVMEESTSSKPYKINGPVIDLFDASLPVLAQKEFQPGERGLLLNLNRIEPKPQVLAAASRASDETITETNYQFTMKSPINTKGVARLWLPHKPEKVIATLEDDNHEFESQWDDNSKTLLLKYENSPEGIKFNIQY